jgi:von Willebrand factor A domain-containing protein 8
MARQELERRLEELNMSSYDARGYGRILSAVETHIASLHDLLEREFFFMRIERRDCF